MEGSKKLQIEQEDSSMDELDNIEESSLSDYSDNERKIFLDQARKHSTHRLSSKSNNSLIYNLMEIMPKVVVKI